MSKTKFIRLDAVEASLVEVSECFDDINNQLISRREPLSPQIIANLMQAYDYLNDLLEQNIPLFERKYFDHIIELNHLVLCGDDPKVRLEYAAHIRETQRYFSNNIGRIKQWYKTHRNSSPYKLAAGIFVITVSQPQLFFEGNHRTGSLMASYVLLEAGKAPFVLTPKNAIAFFNPATLIKSKDKQKLLDHHYYLKKYVKYFTKYLESSLEKKYRVKEKDLEKLDDMEPRLASMTQVSSEPAEYV